MGTLVYLFLALMMTRAAMSAAVFDPLSDCPSRRECHCSITTVECMGRNLTQIPQFSRSTWVFTSIELNLNSITSIPNNAFLFLNVTEVYLNHNLISTISPDAFNGIQDQLKVLDLGNNRLTSLPDVIGKLSAINFLDVAHNPIDAPDFHDNVMRMIGDFIHEFHFGSPELQSWPEAMHHLQGLQVLKFYEGYVNMTTIPIWAFRSFEYTLKKLWIENTHLISVPIALQYLSSIEELHIDNNPNIGDAGILIPAFAGVTNTLHILTLENNSMTTFPSVLLTLPNVRNLSLAGNSLEFVSDQAVGLISSDLKILNLRNCDLDRIPGALSKLQTVTNLDLSHNQITTIEKNDLQRMVPLLTLDVSHNPLRYVSKSTFYNLTNLIDLNLEETHLYNVPEAMTNLPRLQHLNLGSQIARIECNCDLIWLYCYTQKNRNVTIEGTCETVNLFIIDYVRTKVHDVCRPDCSNP